MNLPVIPTHKQKLSLKMEIAFAYPFDLYVIGADASGSKTVFFERLINPDRAGIVKVDFPMPISPEKLRVHFANKSNGDEGAYRIQSIAADYLPRGMVALTQDEMDFLDFYLNFCENASYMPDGIYKSKRGKYWINYMPVIIDDAEGRLETPARIDHNSGEMQISSNKFRNYTVPIRAVIGVHEFSHYMYDTKDETFCDLNALRICLGLGFPSTECLYAFTNIFGDTSQGRSRIAYIENYIKNFKYNNSGRL